MRPMHSKTIIAAIAVTGALMLLPGCTRIDLRETADKTQETVELGEAERAEVELSMGPGDITVTGGATELMEGEFSYNHAALAPEIDYRVSGDVGKLDVSHPEFKPFFIGFGSVRNDWDLAFADDVPMEMRLEHGAGAASLELGGTKLTDLDVDTGAGALEVDVSGSDSLEALAVNAGAGEVIVDLSDGEALRSVDIEAGAGAVTLDLSGASWASDIDVSINAGVGEVIVTVPEGVGVRATAESGVGEVRASGFKSDGEAWTNDAWGTSDIEITLEISHGLGAVTLRQE